MLAAHAHAQLQVGMKIPRRLYMAYEPLIITISISNHAGHDVTLADEDTKKWFGFQITTDDNRLVPPRDTEYHLDPLTIPNGQTVKRSVNLVNLFPVTDFGLYRIKANVFFSEMNRYFSSEPGAVEVSEGKVAWEQTVGAPEGGFRHYALLTFRREKDNMLYARVENKEDGIVYATYPIGRVIAGDEPEIQLDERNQLNVLQLIGPKSFVHTRIGLNGEWLGQVTYNEVKVRPHLRRFANGKVEVLGGQIDAPVAQAANAPPPPKLSDRPAGMPGR